MGQIDQDGGPNIVVEDGDPNLIIANPRAFAQAEDDDGQEKNDGSTANADSVNPRTHNGIFVQQSSSCKIFAVNLKKWVRLFRSLFSEDAASIHYKFFLLNSS